MKKFLAAALFAICLGLFSVPAAQAQPFGPTCNNLQGTPYLCIRNQAMTSIVGIQASASLYNPSVWINIPGGSIMPGGVAIVRFNTWSGGCMQHIIVRTAANVIHAYPYLNVCMNSNFIVTGW